MGRLVGRWDGMAEGNPVRVGRAVGSGVGDDDGGSVGRPVGGTLGFPLGSGEIVGMVEYVGMVVNVGDGEGE